MLLLLLLLLLLTLQHIYIHTCMCSYECDDCALMLSAVDGQRIHVCALISVYMDAYVMHTLCIYTY